MLNCAPASLNPGYATDKSYPWTDNLVNWSCVYNVKDYGGSFELAQKAAVSNGGGVIYYPSGTYSFTSNVVIQSNIVIRQGYAYNWHGKEGD